MKLLKALAVSAFIHLFFTPTTQASLIANLGYTLNSETNIVDGADLEWMQWDVTAGMSISTALQSYSEQGWRVATSSEVYSLFAAFLLFPDNFDLDGSPSYSNFLGQTQFDLFTQIFGFTGVGSSAQYSQVYFGEGADRNWRWGGVRNVTETPTNNAYSQIHTTPPSYYTTQSSQRNSLGVALVRDKITVSEPYSISIFALAIFGFLNRKLAQ